LSLKGANSFRQRADMLGYEIAAPGTDLPPAPAAEGLVRGGQRHLVVVIGRLAGPVVGGGVMQADLAALLVHVGLIADQGSTPLLLDGAVRWRDADAPLLFNVRNAFDLTQAVNLILVDHTGENTKILELLLNFQASPLGGRSNLSNFVHVGVADTQH
jgi:hypothetical protein